MTDELGPQGSDDGSDEQVTVNGVDDGTDEHMGMSGVDEASDEQIIASGGEELERFLSSRADARAELLATFSRQFERGIHRRSWGELALSLETLLGGDGHIVALWPAMTAEITEHKRRLAAIDDVVSPATREAVRAIHAAYYQDLFTAFDLSDQDPDNWRTVSRDVYFDLVNHRPYLRFKIIKFSGEEFTLEGSADSILGLTRSLVVSLGLVDVADAFSLVSSTTFLEDVKPLLANLEERVAAGEDTPAETAQP